jgi:hypothetical protein
MTKQPPEGLKRYFEWTARGARTGRTAYVLKAWDLPEPIPGAEWALDSKFNAAQEILRDPAMKDVFKAVISKGIKIVETPVADGLKAKGK